MHRTSSSVRAAVAALLLALSGTLLLTASPGHGAPPEPGGLRTIATVPGAGGDVAFWGHTAVQAVGADDGDPGNDGFRLIDIANPEQPRVVAEFSCYGSAFDVGVWDDLVFLSVNEPAAETCEEEPSKDPLADTFRGIRVVSIADPRDIRLLASVPSCESSGSHTHTVVPDLAKNRVLLYEGSNCSSITAVPLDEPDRSEVIGSMPLPEFVGCHDISVFLPRKLAAGSCSQVGVVLWDISNPALPEQVAVAPVPGATNSHNTSFSNDGSTLVATDETVTGIAADTCGGGPNGRVWFYDISDLDAPLVPLSSYTRTGRSLTSGFCTAHQTNVVPTTDGRDLLTVAWWTGGTTIVDFTDPRRPTTVAEHATPTDAELGSTNAWSSYFYRGNVYVSHFDLNIVAVDQVRSRRGLEVLAWDDPVARLAVRLPYLNAQTQEAVARGGSGEARGQGRTSTGG